MVNQEYYKLGQKIRNFRIRSGKSQMELELEIGASAGSLSRIENGEVNPTKETLIKLTESLSLNAFEAATLFGLELPNIPSLLKGLENVSSKDDLKIFLQHAVDDLVFEFNLLGAFISVRVGDKLYGMTRTKTWYYDLTLKVIGQPFETLNISLKDDLDNLVVRSCNEKKEFFSNNLNEFIVPAVSSEISTILSKIVNFKCGMSIPILNVKGEPMAAIFFCKSRDEDFSAELGILKSCAIYIANALEKFDK